MIYLSLPEGYVYQRKTVEYTISGKTSHIEKDVFVHQTDSSKKEIIFQDIVLEALRNNQGRKKIIETSEFTIYRIAPPVSEKYFLAYQLKNNGKYVTDKTPELVQGLAAQKYKPNSYTTYGSFWYQNMYLSQKQEEEIQYKMTEQRKNRRHMEGDCPTVS